MRLFAQIEPAYHSWPVVLFCSLRKATWTSAWQLFSFHCLPVMFDRLSVSTSFRHQECIRSLISTSVLPPSLLAKWQLLVASAAVFNTFQNFMTLKLTRRIYNNVPAASGIDPWAPSDVSHSLSSYRPPSSHLRCLDLNLSYRTILRRVSYSWKNVCVVIYDCCCDAHSE